VSAENLFIPSFGNRPAQLVGREGVIKGFVNGLAHTAGHPNRSTLLIGQRGMGKTALLLEFADIAEQEGFVVARVTAQDGMLEDLMGMIQRKGASALDGPPKVKGVSAGAFGFSAGLTFADGAEKDYSFLNKLVLLCEALEKRGKGVAILVDEVQSKTPEMRVLATAYQHLVGEGGNVVMAMAGLPYAISAVLNDDILTFLNRAKKVHLGPLPLDAVGIYYAQAFAGMGKPLSAGQLAEVTDATRGYPYLLQLIGYYLVEFSANSPSITEATVAQALASAKRGLVEGIYEPALKPLSKTDLAFLKAMAADDGPSSVADIEKRLHTTRHNVQAYRRRLIDAHVIASERRGELEATIPYIKEYLRGTL
jgi:hypothetical protein